MSKMEDILGSAKVSDVLSAAKLNNLIKKDEEEKKPSKFVIVFAIIGSLLQLQQLSMEFIVSLHRIIWMISRTILKMNLIMISSKMKMMSQLQLQRMILQRTQNNF